MALIGIVAIGLFVDAPWAATPPLLETTIYTKTGERMMQLEIASTPKMRERGLMRRNTLKPYDGMIFLFPLARDYAFWMKDTPLPLDMLFLNEESEIVYIASNTTPYSMKELHANVPVRSVIELDGGRCDREGIALGDKVRYALPSSLEIR